MSYAVKELYYTLQGEGAQAGRPAVFLRFAGCNLWSGRDFSARAGRCCLGRVAEYSKRLVSPVRRMYRR